MKPSQAYAIKKSIEAKERLVSTQSELTTCHNVLKAIVENPHACTCVREFSWYGEGHTTGCPVAQAMFALGPEQRRKVRAAKKILGE